MTEINNIDLTVTVISATEFSVGVDSTGYGAYVSGGVITPNPRNVTVNINDYPDVYQVTYVNPPQQAVAMTVTWNTISTNFVSPVVIAQLAIPALVNYVNSVIVGQPINVFDMNKIFQEAVAGVLPTQLLTRLVFEVSINGVGVSPTSGTGIIAGDPESYFLTNSGAITVVQG